MTQFKSEHLPLTKEHYNDWCAFQKENYPDQWRNETYLDGFRRYLREFPTPTLDQAIQIIKDAGGKVLMPTTEYKEV
jgi:hypothetical protein